MVKIITLEEAIGNNQRVGTPINTVIYDGDGDGIPAAAIWLMDKSGEWAAVTNKQKNERALVEPTISNIINECYEWGKGIYVEKAGVFDLDAENNSKGLELLSSTSSNVDFVDHHTRDLSKIPNGVNNFAKSDTRDNSTATISYDLAEYLGVLENPVNRYKATQLAIIGLANDGKGSASQKFGGDLISFQDREDLIKYAKAINFGAGGGISNGIELLNGFVNNLVPVDYLRNSKEVNYLFKKREETIRDIGNRTLKQEINGLVTYVFPHDNMKDKETSLMAYNEFMNSQMENCPSKVHSGILKTPENKWRISIRDINEGAYKIANSLASQYSLKVSGRDTAAGFDLAEEIDSQELLNKIIGVYNEIQ